MNAPPGWQQQPPPPPGYGYGPPPMPPKKNKAPLVVGIIVGVLLLGGGGTAAAFYFDAHEDSGSAHTGDELPGLCGNVSEQTLAQARTTNPNGKMSSERDVADGKVTTCDWKQTKGRDGEGLRNLSVHIEQSEDAAEAYDRMSGQSKANTQGEIQVKEIEIGDQGTAVLMITESAFTGIDIVARKGDHVVEVDYTGWDVGLFSPKQPDLTEFEANAKAVADEILAEL